MKALYILIITLLLTTLGANAEESHLDSAASAYKNGDYSRAINIYSEIADKHGVSAPLLANLGSAYVKSGDLGKGRLYYERSLRLDPSNSVVKGNIRYIASKVEDNNKADASGKKVSVTPEDKGFFHNVKNYIVFRHTADLWGTWAAVFFILSCCCWAGYIFLSEVLLRKVGFFGGLICLGISLVLIIFSFWSAKEARTAGSGIITGYKVSLVSEPYVNSKVSSNPLNRGTKLDVLDTETTSDGKDKWYKVRLNSDYVGWVRSDDFEII